MRINEAEREQVWLYDDEQMLLCGDQIICSSKQTLDVIYLHSHSQTPWSGRLFLQVRCRESKKVGFVESKRSAPQDRNDSIRTAVTLSPRHRRCLSLQICARSSSKAKCPVTANIHSSVKCEVQVFCHSPRRVIKSVSATRSTTTQTSPSRRFSRRVRSQRQAK